MLGSLDTVTLVLILILIGISLGAGRLVQEKTKFIWPHDVVSICLLMVSVVDLIYAMGVDIDATPWHPFIWLFVWLGYFGGFAAGSHKDYVHLLLVRSDMDSEMTQEEIESIQWMKRFHKKTGAGITMPYIVPYKIGTKWYLRRQTNKDLLKDWFFGILTEVETDADLRASQEFTASHPWFPIPSIMYIPTEIFDVKWEIVRKGKMFECRRYKVRIVVAPAHMANALEIAIRMRAHQKDVLAVQEARRDKLRAEFDIPRQVADEMMTTFTHAVLKTAPGVKLYEASQELKKDGQKEPDDLKRIRKKLFRTNKEGSNGR